MTFELAPVDGLDDEQLKDMANLFAAKCQKSAQQTVKDAVIAGNALNELKSRAKHGEWRAWLRTNFDYSHETARAYQTLAANVNRLTFEPASIKQALRAIAEEKSDEPEEPVVTPRAERVTGRVKVSPDPVEKSKSQDENAVPPEPKTNTKHTKSTAKAKEADWPAPPVVTPEIVEEPEQPLPEKTTLSDFCVSEILDYLKSSADDAKKRARELRKAADELDPPEPEQFAIAVVEPQDGGAAHTIASEYVAAMGGRVVVSAKRKKVVASRMRDPFWREHWREALDIASSSPFLQGQNDRGWKMSFDFFLKPDSVAKIIEGTYDGAPKPQQQTAAERREQLNATSFDWIRQAAAAAEREQASDVARGYLGCEVSSGT